MRRIVPCLIAAAALPTYAQGFLTPRGEHAADPPSQVFRLASQRVEIDLDRQYATTTLTQEFENLLPARIEGAYTLRTSGGTLAEGFAYWNGEEKIVGEVFERSRARAVYDQIVRLHRDPGLLEHAGEGAFSLNGSRSASASVSPGTAMCWSTACPSQRPEAR
jgi:Ca-activated chloride channel family protein